MAKKPNIIEMTPELPSTSPPKWVWPQNQEKRLLTVTLQERERLAIAEENCRLGVQKDQLEDNKKASASQYKAQIEAVEAQIRENNTYVSTGKKEQRVECDWFYEVAGFDSVTGEPIQHSDKKTLVRRDTKEVVEICDITDAERQAALPLEQDALADEGDAQPVTVGDDE